MVTFKRMVLAAIAIFVLSNSCNRNKSWLDSSFRLVDDEHRAEFYIESGGEDSIGSIGIIYRNRGVVLAVGHFVDSTLQTMDGPMVFYWPNGNIESMGSYDHGLKTGEWRRFDPKGIELSTRIYEPKAVRPYINE